MAYSGAEDHRELAKAAALSGEHNVTRDVHSAFRGCADSLPAPVVHALGRATVMFFDFRDAERLAAWKRQIESGKATKEGLRGEISYHFTLNGTHDPDDILQKWNKISVAQDPSGSWVAVLRDRSQMALLPA
jgi:hypothetical protein